MQVLVKQRKGNHREGRVGRGPYKQNLVVQLVKNLPAVWETWVGKIPWRRERLPLQYSGLENSMDCIGLEKLGHD